MKPEAQQAAIAEACGWIRVRINEHGEQVWQAPPGGGPMPDYLNDLNAMHEAEAVLPLQQREVFSHELARVIFLRDGKGVTPEFHSAIDLAEDFAIAHATAAQRAEAFLRTLGKWRDG